jgi:hypothetical protein
MSKHIIQKVRIGGTSGGKVSNLVVTVPKNSDIKAGDYVRIIKIEVEQ